MGRGQAKQMDQQVNRPTIYQFKFGECVITNILEGYLHRDDLHPFVATNAVASEIEDLAREYQLPFPALEHNFVATIIQTPEKLIVIDPGFGGAAPAPTTGWFERGLTEAGYVLGDVDVVLISHCHPDHIGNVAQNGKLTFPNAQVVIGRIEFDYWKRGEGVSKMREPTLALFQKVLLPLEDQMRFIEPDDEIVPGLTAVNAYGHSAGHLVFKLSTGDKELILLNDATPHYVASFANPDWHFVMDDDAEMAAISRRRVLEMATIENLPVIGFHIPFPAIGYVERRGGGYEFRPATYQFNLP